MGWILLEQQIFKSSRQQYLYNQVQPTSWKTAPILSTETLTQQCTEFSTVIEDATTDTFQECVKTVDKIATKANIKRTLRNAVQFQMTQISSTAHTIIKCRNKDVQA